MMHLLGPAVACTRSPIVCVENVELSHAAEALVGLGGWAEAVVPFALVDADRGDLVFAGD